MNIYIKKGNINNNQFVIENIQDLLKLSSDELENAKFSDFSGKYFEQIFNGVIEDEKKPKNQKKIQNKQTNEVNKVKRNIQNRNDDINNNKELSNFIIENEEYKNNKINDIDFKADNLNNNELYIPQYKSLDSPISERNKFEVDRNFNNPIYPIKKIIFSIYYNTIFGQEIAISGSNDKLGNWDKHRLLFLNWSKGNKWIGEIDINDEELDDFEFKFVLCQNKEIIAWEPGENNNVYFTALFNEFKEFPKGRYNKYQYEYNKNKGELTLNCKWSN